MQIVTPDSPLPTSLEPVIYLPNHLPAQPQTLAQSSSSSQELGTAVREVRERLRNFYTKFKTASGGNSAGVCGTCIVLVSGTALHIHRISSCPSVGILSATLAARRQARHLTFRCVKCLGPHLHKDCTIRSKDSPSLAAIRAAATSGGFCHACLVQDDSHSTLFHSQGAFGQLACDSGGVDVITAIINTLYFARPDFIIKHMEGRSSWDVMEKSTTNDVACHRDKTLYSMPSHTDFNKWAATSWSHFLKMGNGAVLVWVFMSCGGSDKGDLDDQTASLLRILKNN